VLDVDAAVTLLANRGLLDRAEVIDGELRIIDASRRNHNLQVLRSCGPSYIIKQGLGTERRLTVAHEAAVHECLGSIQDEVLAALLPRVVTYAPAECLLILELVRDGESLESYHFRHRTFSVPQARRLAKALVAVHSVTAAEALKLSSPPQLGAGLPWSLWSLHRPDVSTFGGLSNGGMLASRMIQNAVGFGELLDAAGAEWTPSCLIHGDLRFDNCVLAPAPGSMRKDRLKLVDWELAVWGDPCWDAGAVLASYLSSWLLSCPISGETPPETVAHLGRYRLADMRRAAGAFWAAYDAGMAQAGAVSLHRTMRFAAVKLLQFMVEDLQTSVVLTGRAVCLAQLALNLLKDPHESAEHFLATRIES
jgi:hypothetical protein